MCMYTQTRVHEYPPKMSFVPKSSTAFRLFLRQNSLFVYQGSTEKPWRFQQRNSALSFACNGSPQCHHWGSSTILAVGFKSLTRTSKLSLRQRKLPWTPTNFKPTKESTQPYSGLHLCVHAHIHVVVHVRVSKHLCMCECLRIDSITSTQTKPAKNYCKNGRGGRKKEDPSPLPASLYVNKRASSVDRTLTSSGWVCSFRQSYKLHDGGSFSCFSTRSTLRSLSGNSRFKGITLNRYEKKHSYHGYRHQPNANHKHFMGQPPNEQSGS